MIYKVSYLELIHEGCDCSGLCHQFTDAFLAITYILEKDIQFIEKRDLKKNMSVEEVIRRDDYNSKGFEEDTDYEHYIICKDIDGNERILRKLQSIESV